MTAIVFGSEESQRILLQDQIFRGEGITQTPVVKAKKEEIRKEIEELEKAMKKKGKEASAAYNRYYRLTNQEGELRKQVYQKKQALKSLSKPPGIEE